MFTREFYTIDRSPEEIRALLAWATAQTQGKIHHEAPYAMGILATLEYLMGQGEELPQHYKGLFSPEAVLTQAQQGQNIGGMADANVKEPLHETLDHLRPGNPKCLLYKATVCIGGTPCHKGRINNGGDVLHRDTDNRGG